MNQVLKCILKCFEKCLKYMTTNAYILIAMRGFSFWGAAISVVRIITQNFAQLALASALTTWVTLLGKVFITLAVFVMANTWIENEHGQ